MSRLIKILILFISSALFLTSCEDVIDLPLKDAEPMLVIDGSVSNLRQHQEVLLSQMQPFDSPIRRKAISGAEVYLNEDRGPWRRLWEVSEGRYIIENIRGKPGSTYGMRVNYAGVSYEAESTMPELVRIDSTGFSTNTFDDSRRTPLVLYQDPQGVKNFYYFELMVNEVVNSSIFIYNDKFNDGKVVTENLDDFSLELKSGDKVVVELRNIDESNFNYWRSVQSQNGGSASPGNPLSNISNGALGTFSAYSAHSVYFVVDDL